MNEGWIKLHRSLINWEWYSDIPTKVLFLHLLLIAKYEDRKWQNILIKKGQILTGRKTLSKQTGLTEQQIRTSLDKLKLTNEITIKVTRKYSIISITNYEKYQQDNQQNNQEATNNQPTEQPTEQPSNNQVKTSDNLKDNELCIDEQPTKNQQLFKKVTTTKEYKNIRKKEYINIKEILLPDFISQEIWNDFLEMRIKIKRPATDKAKELLIKKLTNFYNLGENPNEILERSILNNWQDIYQLQKKNPNETHSNSNQRYTKPSTTQQLREGIARLGEKYGFE